MSKLLSFIAIGLMVLWAIAVLIFHAGYLVHVLLILAGISLVLRCAPRLRSSILFGTKMSFYIFISFFYLASFICKDIAED